MLARFSPRARIVVGLAMVLAAVAIGLVAQFSLIAAGDREVLEEFIEMRTRAATAVMKAVTAVFNPVSAIVLALVLGALVWWRTRNRWAAAYIVGAMGVSAVITQGLKLAFRMARPDAVNQLIVETDYGFPSGHTTAVTSLAVALALLATAQARRWSRGLVLVWVGLGVVALLVTGSRLYLGVHWFTDVLGGFLIGAGCAVALSVLPIGRQDQLIE